MRKTKIICTLGPAKEMSEVLRQLIQQGSDVFRLNMSHASHDWVRNIVPRIRMLAQKADRPVALLLDTQGPAIRTGDVETNLHLKPGDILEFTVCAAKSKERYSLYVNYRFFFVFFFNDTATTEIYTLSLHDALPISSIVNFGAFVDLGGVDGLVHVS